MNAIKRIFAFIVTNLAVVAMIVAVSLILEHFFNIRIGINGGTLGLLIYAVVIGFAGSFISLFISRWSAKRLYNIEPMKEERLMDYSPKEQLVYTIVARIARENAITIPEVGSYESSDPNAFATGYSKNASLVAVSTGLLNTMNQDEIEGVIGHEMAHILNGDMVTMTLMQGVLNTFVIFGARVLGYAVDRFISKDEESSGIAYMLFVWLFEIVLGILASVVLMAFSRYREYRADEGSAKMLGKDKMIKALKSLRALSAREVAQEEDDKLTAFKISSRRASWLGLFSSHPDINDRIRNLEEKVIF